MSGNHFPHDGEHGRSCTGYGCDCDETLALIADGKIDTTPLITHTYPLAEIEAAYERFESRQGGVMKIAIK